MDDGGLPLAPSLPEKLLAVMTAERRKVTFLCRWLKVGCLCSRGWLHTHVHMVSANWAHRAINTNFSWHKFRRETGYWVLGEVESGTGSKQNQNTLHACIKVSENK